MAPFSKYLLVVAAVGLVGIAFFMLDLSDLSWKTNREVYWGAIALIAMAGAVVFEGRAKKIERLLKKKPDKSSLS